MKDQLDPDLFKKTINLIDNKADYVDIRVTDSRNTAIIMKDGRDPGNTLRNRFWWIDQGP